MKSPAKAFTPCSRYHCVLCILPHCYCMYRIRRFRCWTNLGTMADRRDHSIWRHGKILKSRSLTREAMLGYSANNAHKAQASLWRPHPPVTRHDAYVLGVRGYRFMMSGTSALASPLRTKWNDLTGGMRWWGVGTSEFSTILVTNDFGAP